MLIRIDVAAHGGHVNAALVGEGAAAHVGHVRVVRHVGDVGHEQRKLSHFLQLARLERAKAELQFQVWHDHRQVGVAATLTKAVDGALYVAGTGQHRR